MLMATWQKDEPNMILQVWLVEYGWHPLREDNGMHMGHLSMWLSGR